MDVMDRVDIVDVAGDGAAAVGERGGDAASTGASTGAGRSERDRWIAGRLEWARGVAALQGWDGSWIRNLSDVVAVEHGCWFDVEAGEDACEFIEKFCRYYKGSRAGDPLELCEWQRRDVVMPVFGWKRPDGTRRVRTAYIEVPRKNGKSTLAAAIALYLLVADGEMGASVVSAATTREQARVVFKSAVQMVRLGEELRGILHVYRDSIVFEAMASSYVVISADAGPQHGRDDSGIIFDELHAQPNDELWKVMRSGVGSRPQPLIFVVTTSGDEKGTVCWEQHERAVMTRNNELTDDSFYGFIASAGEKDDWWLLETMIRANPALDLDGWIVYEDADESGYRRVRLSETCPFDFRFSIADCRLGEGERGGDAASTGTGTGVGGWDGAAIEGYVEELTRFVRRFPEYGVGAVRLDNLVDELREAVDSNSARARWKWLHLNLWEEASFSWMEGWRWDKCGVGVDRKSLKGRRCFGGLDLASKIDMTAFVLVFPPERKGERWQVLAWYWVPEETARERTLKDKVPYLDWIRDGWVRTTSGATADYDEIGHDIQELRKEFKIEQIGYDPWNAGQLATQLSGFGYVMVESPQTLRWMSDPMKEIEAKVISEQIAHDGNPVLRWNVVSCVARVDVNGNVRPDKEKVEKAKKKIDGLVAMIMGMGRAILAMPRKSSKYGAGMEPASL